MADINQGLYTGHGYTVMDNLAEGNKIRTNRGLVPVDPMTHSKSIPFINFQNQTACCLQFHLVQGPLQAWLPSFGRLNPYYKDVILTTFELERLSDHNQLIIRPSSIANPLTS